MATSKDISKDLSESVWTKWQIRLPTYLSDYQVNVTGHRELTSSHVGNMAAKTTFRSEEEGNTECDELLRGGQQWIQHLSGLKVGTELY